MGWLDWIFEHGEAITTRIETGLKELLGLPSEIEPVLPARPATVEQIAEAVEESVYAQRFIAEIIPDEAARLARGVPFYERLTNVARMRHWTALSPQDVMPSPDYQISVRGVLVGPDGRMTHVDVAFPTGEAYSEKEFVRRAASALEDDFVSGYKGVPRSDMIRKWLVALETYIQRYKPF